MSRLEAMGVGVSLKNRQVLSGVDLTVRAGEMLGLLGPNGAGKTTLLKALAGLLPCSGQVRLDGRSVHALSASLRARGIAYLPQISAAHWPMPVEAVVALGRLPHRRGFGGQTETDRAAIARAMRETDIGGLAARPLNALSGGERARVLLARALAVEASVLLADEPVAYLDPGHQLAVLDLLANRAAKGEAVVVVLHDLALAARHCHRVAVLDEGAVAADGRPFDVLDDALLKRIYHIGAIRGIERGQPFLLPWEVAAP